MHVMQRTTGDERLLTATFDGDLPSSCTLIETAGSPTDEELTAAYATDDRTKNLTLEETTTAPLLEADWWPEGQHQQTTALCGRWWVSQSEDTLYAFAPELQVVADGITNERDQSK